jgi:tetratricopeptide (TPR) repeat protein
MQQASLERARELGLPYEVGRACYNRSESLFGLGRYAEARAMFEELYAYGARIHSALHTGLGLRLLIELDWRLGRWAAALARQPEALEVAGGSVTVWQAAIFAEMNNDLGQPARARRDMEHILEQLAKIEQIQTLVPCLEQLARAYTSLGLENEAAQTIQRYLELIDCNPYLHWVCDMPLLSACRWYAQRADTGALDAARACVQRLERAHAQMISWRPESRVSRQTRACSRAPEPMTRIFMASAVCDSLAYSDSYDGSGEGPAWPVRGCSRAWLKSRFKRANRSKAPCGGSSGRSSRKISSRISRSTPST